MNDKWPGKEGDIRFFMGAKSATETSMWKPKLKANQMMIEYVRAMMGFETETG